MIYVDPFLGAGAVWLSLLDASLVPLVSWMGGKRRLSARILAALDLAPGRVLLGSRVGEVPPCLLGDASWWGWVWPVCLDPVTGPRVAAILRSWRGEDPRALWFRLRAAGPFADPCEAAAQLLWLQARAASGVPVWWEGCEVLAAPGDGRERQRAYERTPSTPLLVSMDGHGRGPYPAWQMTGQAREEGAPPRAGRSSSGHPGSGADDVRAACAKGVHGGPGRTPRPLQEASTQIDEAGQRQATEPKLLAQSGARRDGSRGACGASMKGRDSNGGGGIVDPGTIAGRLDAIRERLTVMPTIEHRGALDLTLEWAPRIGKAGLVYLDPPYQGATGYPAVCPRDEVLTIAETWARHGARVVLSEAVGLAGDLGPGWEQEQLPSTRKPEWITVYAGRAAA